MIVSSVVHLMLNWLTLQAGYSRDPSLRLKNGFSEDDIVL